MEINQVTQMIIEFAPIITTLIGILVSIIVGINRIKNSNTNTYNKIKKTNDDIVKELKDTNDRLVEENKYLVEVNEQLRSDMSDLMLELKNIHTKHKK